MRRHTSVSVLGYQSNIFINQDDVKGLYIIHVLTTWKRFSIISLGVLLFLSGCATVPVRQALPTYTLHGISYVSLSAFCNLKSINFDYDTYTRTATLRKGVTKVNVRVGDTLVLVNGVPERLQEPVDTYNGEVVIPLLFKERIAMVFGEGAPVIRPVFSQTNIKRIVLDAGHGGNDPGAIGRSGLKEKDVNLDIVKRLAKILKDRGAEVIVTRQSDRFVTLPGRVDIANDAKADLFISIHSNANRVRSLNGFEVYYITPSTSDSRRASSAAQDGLPDITRGSVASSSFNLKAILWDMINTNNRAESIELARQICRSINRDLDTKVLGIKAANFHVLRGTRMPAVLIEIGFLSNSGEERLLKNGYYRQQIAESIEKGVEDYASNFLIVEAAR